MTESSTSAVRVDRFVTVEVRTAVHDVFPCFVLRDITCDLGSQQLRGDDEVIDIQQINVVACQAGFLVDLAGSFSGRMNFKERVAGFKSRVADTEDLDRFVLRVFFSQICRAEQDAGCAVTLVLKTGDTLDRADLRVAVGLHVFHNIVVTCFFRNVFIELVLDRERVIQSVMTCIDGELTQSLIDLIVCQTGFRLIPVSGIIMADVRQEMAGISVVCKPGSRDLEFLKAEGFTDICRFSLDSERITEVDAAGQNDVVFTGSDRLGSDIDGQIAGAAGFGMMKRSFASHTEPFSDLHVRCEVVGTIQRACAAVVVELDVLRGNAGIFHCL